MADHVVDTSEMTVHELRQAFTGVAAGRVPGNQLVVTILSFGFKHGIPVASRICSSTCAFCRTRTSCRRCSR